MFLKIVLVLTFVCIAQGDGESKNFGNLITLGHTGFPKLLGSGQTNVCLTKIKSDYEKAVQNFIGQMVGLLCETEKMLKTNPKTENPVLSDNINSLVCSVKMYPLGSQVKNIDPRKLASVLETTNKAIDNYDQKLKTFLTELENTNKLTDENNEAEKPAQKYTDIRGKTIKEFDDINTKFIGCFYVRP